MRISAKSGHTLSLLRPSGPQGLGPKENGLVFDIRTDTNDNGGGKVREYRGPLAPDRPLHINPQEPQFSEPANRPIGHQLRVRTIACL